MEEYKELYDDSHDKFILNLLGIKTELNSIQYERKESEKHMDMDCTTRAFSTLLNMPYKEVLRIQHTKALEQELAFANFDDSIKAILEDFDFEEVCVKPMSISNAEFMYTHKKGSYAIVSAAHMYAYIDGTWYDNECGFMEADHYLTEKIWYVYKKKD